jgi:hypothetical protein
MLEHSNWVYTHVEPADKKKQQTTHNIPQSNLQKPIHSSNDRKMNKFLKKSKKPLMILFGVNIFLQTVVRPTLSAGPSMEPTLDTNGEVLITENFSRLFLLRPLQKGDVIITMTPDQTKRKYLWSIVMV